MLIFRVSTPPKCSAKPKGEWNIMRIWGPWKRHNLRELVELNKLICINKLPIS